MASQPYQNLNNTMSIRESFDTVEEHLRNYELLKEFISLLREDIQEDIFDYLPEFANEAEEKARGLWPEVQAIVDGENA